METSNLSAIFNCFKTSKIIFLNSLSGTLHSFSQMKVKKKQTTVAVGQIQVEVAFFNVVSRLDLLDRFVGKVKSINHIVNERSQRNVCKHEHFSVYKSRRYVDVRITLQGYRFYAIAILLVKINHGFNFFVFESLLQFRFKVGGKFSLFTLPLLFLKCLERIKLFPILIFQSCYSSISKWIVVFHLRKLLLESLFNFLF